MRVVWTRSAGVVSRVVSANGGFESLLKMVQYMLAERFGRSIRNFHYRSSLIRIVWPCDACCLRRLHSRAL